MAERTQVPETARFFQPHGPALAATTPAVQREIDKRKQKMREFLAGDTLTQFPRDEMREVLTFWNVHL